MIPLGGDSWTLTTGDDPDISFCVWVLLRDGLRADPFNAHDDGDGRLRAVGLTADSWRGWFESIVRTATERQELLRADSNTILSKDDAPTDLSELLYGDEPPTPDQINEARRAIMARTAAGRWPQQDQVRAELLRRWPSYMRHEKEKNAQDFERTVQRHRLLERLTNEQVHDLVQREREVWEKIQRFRPLPPLHFYTVDYPTPVVEIVPPASAVLGGIDADETSEARNQLVLEAAKRLRAVADER